jgi:hypothetical protein
MIPLQIEDAGYTGAVAFEAKTPGGRADPRRKIGRRQRGLRENVPAGEGGAGLRRTGLAKEQPHDPALARPERQATTGGEVEFPWISADFREGGGKAPAAEPLLEDPERLAGTADADEDQATGIEAETDEAGTIGKAAFALGSPLQNPENRPFVGDQGEEGGGEAGGRPDLWQAAADLVQGVPPDAAAKRLVEGGDSEGQKAASPWPERSGLFRQPLGMANLFADVEAREMALDLGDPTSQPGNILPCHRSVLAAHGVNSLVPDLFY